MLCRRSPRRAPAFNSNAATTALSSLRASPETDNCGSALWLVSSAMGSSLLRSPRFSFPPPAKNIRSARCPTSSGNKVIRQQEIGPKKAKRTSRKLHRLRQKLPGTKLVRQGRSNGQTQISNLATKSNRHAAGRSVHHRQRSGRTFLLLRHEVGPDRLHGALHLESVRCARADELERSLHVHALLRFRRLLSPDSWRDHCRRSVRQILDHPVALARLLPGQSYARLHGHFLGSCHRATADARNRIVPDLFGRRWNQAVCLGQRWRSVRRIEQASAIKDVWLVLFLDQRGIFHFLDPLSVVACESEVRSRLGVWNSRHSDGHRYFVFLGRPQENGARAASGDYFFFWPRNF